MHLLDYYRARRRSHPLSQDELQLAQAGGVQKIIRVGDVVRIPVVEREVTRGSGSAALELQLLGVY
jgi:hypothetical protein